MTRPTSSASTRTYRQQRMVERQMTKIWHGVTAATKPDEYLEYMNRTGVADYASE
jgi:hypothetical protein